MRFTLSTAVALLCAWAVISGCSARDDGDLSRIDPTTEPPTATVGQTPTNAPTPATPTPEQIQPTSIPPTPTVQPTATSVPTVATPTREPTRPTSIPPTPTVEPTATSVAPQSSTNTPADVDEIETFADGLIEFVRRDFLPGEWSKVRLAYAYCVERTFWYLDDDHASSTIEAVASVDFLDRMAYFVVEATGATGLEQVADTACLASINWIEERMLSRVYDYINQYAGDDNNRYREDLGEWPNLATPPDSAGRFEDAQALVNQINANPSSHNGLRDVFDIYSLNFPSNTTFDTTAGLVAGVVAGISCVEYMESGGDVADRTPVEESLPKALAYIDADAQEATLRELISRIDLVELHAACLGFKNLAEKNASYWALDLEGFVDLPPPN